MTKQEASALIAKKVKAAQQLISEATEIADENKVSFRFDGPDGKVYGMGGSYEPRVEWNSSHCEWDDSGCSEDEDYGWKASSQSC